MAQDGRTRRRRRTCGGRARTAALAVILLVAVPSFALEVRSDTGLRATIHGPEEIGERWLTEVDGVLTLDHPQAGVVELRAPADGTTLVPAEAVRVADALAAVRGFRADLHVHVFLLPVKPAAVSSSFARRDAIFLAPTAGRPADETLAYEVVHELGHVLCWAALDGRPARWEAYRRLRGLDEQPDPGALPHAERNREIIAEDLRYLFGGPVATASGTIENAGLPLPDEVPGLRELLRDYLASAAGPVDRLRPTTVYPNPCREAARVELALPTGADKAVGEAVLEVYDLRGRLIRRVTGGTAVNGRATVTWDGDGPAGRRAASGIYLYRIAAGRHVGAGRLLLVDR